MQLNERTPELSQKQKKYYSKPTRKKLGGFPQSTGSNQVEFLPDNEFDFNDFGEVQS